MLAAAVAVLPACTRSASTSDKAAPSTPPQVAVNQVPPAATVGAPADPNATATPPAPVPVHSGPSSHAAATPSESPTGGAPASAPVAATPSASPGAATATPSPAPTGPRIVSVSATPSIVHNGDTVRWDVRTSPDVVAVSAKVATYGFDLQRSGPGHFTLGFAIPKSVPFFFHRTYTLDVVARDGAGATANTTIALSFQ